MVTPQEAGNVSDYLFSKTTLKTKRLQELI